MSAPEMLGRAHADRVLEARSQPTTPATPTPRPAPEAGAVDEHEALLYGLDEAAHWLRVTADTGTAPRGATYLQSLARHVDAARRALATPAPALPTTGGDVPTSENAGTLPQTRNGAAFPAAIEALRGALERAVGIIDTECDAVELVAELRAVLDAHPVPDEPPDDTRRLDWLESQLRRLDDRWKVEVFLAGLGTRGDATGYQCEVAPCSPESARAWGSWQAPTLRAAIDAARDAQRAALFANLKPVEGDL